MTLNTQIPLGVQSVDTANPLMQYANFKGQLQDRELKTKVADAQLEGMKYENLDKREKSRVNSVILGAAELKTYLDSGDTEGAKSFLLNRKENLQKRLAGGENIDTQETDRALELIDTDPEKLKKSLDAHVQFGQMTGILKKPEGKGFNLKPGENRYDASGKLIASGGQKVTPEKGYMLAEDGKSQVPIPGGSADNNQKKGEEIKQTTLNVVNRLIQNAEGVRANRGGISSKIPNVTDTAVNAEADLGVLASLLTTENIKLLKGTGSFSDADLALLRDIGAGGLKGADEQVLQNLADIKIKLEGGVQGQGGAAQPSQQAQAPQVGDAIIGGKLNYANPKVQAAFDADNTLTPAELVEYFNMKR